MGLTLDDIWDIDAEPVQEDIEEDEEEEPANSIEDNYQDRELTFGEVADRGLCIFSFRATAGEGHNEFEFRVIGVNDDEDRSRGRLKLSDFPQFKGEKVKVKERRLGATQVLNYMQVDYSDGSYEIFETSKSQIVTDLSDPEYFEYVIDGG